MDGIVSSWGRILGGDAPSLSIEITRERATYDRILRHIEGHQIVVHCTVTRQLVHRRIGAGTWKSSRSSGRTSRTARRFAPAGLGARGRCHLAGPLRVDDVFNASLAVGSAVRSVRQRLTRRAGAVAPPILSRAV